MGRLDDKRAALIAQRKRVTTKINRMAKVYDANIAGTRLDPRKSASEIRNMNSRQLAAYQRSIDRFMHRDTGYVGEALHPIREVRKYLSVETRYNNVAKPLYDVYKNLPGPGGQQSVAERDALMEGRPRMATDASNRPLSPVKRDPRNVPSTKALRRLTKQLERKMAQGAYERNVKRGRKQANQMLKTIGDAELTKQIRKLTDREFDFLFNFHGLANDLRTRYKGAKEADGEDLEEGYAAVVANAIDTEFFSDKNQPWRKHLAEWDAAQAEQSK